MYDNKNTEPDHTAVRVALWRALHLEVDSAPHVFEDEVGLRLVEPEDGWRQRPDMDPERTSGGRASIVARARFIEDLVTEQVGNCVNQYVILGAALTPLLSAGRISPPGCRSSRSTSPKCRPGRDNA